MGVSETTDHGLTCQCGETFDTADKLEEHVAKHRWQPDPRECETRAPTDAELEDLVAWYRDAHEMDRREAVRIVNQCFHATIADYRTDCPGYAAPVLIEIGGIGPSYHAVYTWRNGDLHRKDQAEEIRLHSEGGV